MTSDKVVTLALGFHGFWSHLLKDYPKYRLDHSWPSIGTVDLILSRFYNKKQFSENDLTVINGAAAYLGGIIHDVWVNFAPQIEVSLTSTGKNEVVIKASNAKLAPKQRPFELAISKALISILSNPQNPFPCYADYRLPVIGYHNRISLFMLGAITGLSPFGVGDWTKANPDQVVNHINAALNYAATSSAEYYKSCYPAEILGANPALYAAGLIIPPAEDREKYHLQWAIYGIVDYFEHAQVGRDQMIGLCYNLALSPDPRIAELGLIMSLALAKSPIPNELRLLFEVYQGDRYALRIPLIFARSALGKKDDWLELLEQGFSEEAEELFTVEKEAGLCQDLTIPFDLAQQKEINLAVAGVVFQKLKQVREYIDKLSISKPLSIDMVIQGIAIDIRLGQIDRAEQELKNIEAYLPNEPNNKKLVLELTGLVHIIRGRAPAAVEALKEAYAVASTDPLIEANVAAHYSSALLFSDKLLELLEMTDKAKKSPFVSFLTYFNRLRGLQRAKDDRFLPELQQLARKLPFNHSVFSLIIDQATQEPQE